MDEQLLNRLSHMLCEESNRSRLNEVMAHQFLDGARGVMDAWDSTPMPAWQA